jgi:DNA-binding transcriptional ArsR family regulator
MSTHKTIDSQARLPYYPDMRMEAVAPDLMFKALADSTRQRLLGVLTAHELSVSELVEVLDQPQSTISRHLKILRGADLLLDRREGAMVRYAARPVAEKDGNGKSRGTSGGYGVIRDQLLEWAQHERLDPGIKKRLNSVLRRRKSDSTDFFETLGRRWDQLRIEAFGEAFHFEALTALLPSEWVVADIGTGTGYLLPALSARFEKVIAIEPAGAMLEAARNRPGLENAHNIVFRSGSLADLPIQTGELDLAIASLVLHHVSEPQAALREIRRCVGDGGKLLMIEQEAHEHAAFHDRMGDEWWGFEPASLNSWVGEAGFADVRVSKLSSVHPSARVAGEVPGLFVLTANAAQS